MRSTDPVRSEIADQIRVSASWGIALGIILIVLGIVALARPFYATIASTFVFGWLFIFAGIAKIVYSFISRGEGRVIWKLLLGLLYLGAGIYVISNPAIGVAALTLALGITIFAQGVIEVIMAFQLKPAKGWVWVLIGGVAGVILGILIWSQFPSTAVWVLGFWVGIHLLLSGVWILTLSSAMRSALR